MTTVIVICYVVVFLVRPGLLETDVFRFFALRHRPAKILNKVVFQRAAKGSGKQKGRGNIL